MKENYKGKFRVDSGRNVLEFHTVDGKFFDIVTTENVPLEVSLEITLVDGKLSQWKRDTRLLKVSSGEIVIALAKIAKFGEEITELDLKAMAMQAKKVQDEYRRMGLYITVKPHILNQYDGPLSLRGFRWNFLINYLEEVDPSTNYTHYHGWGGYESGICGRAWVGGTQAWTYSTCNYKTIIHEQGHNFGLSHAGTPTSVYGESDVYMGSGTGRFDMNAPHLEVLGVIDSEDSHTIDKGNDGGTFFLTQASKNTLSLPPNVKKIIKVEPRAGEFKIISVSYYDGDVRIHTPSNAVSRRFVMTHVTEKLRVGEATTFDNVTVEYLEQRNGVAKVVIKNGVENVSDPKPWPEFVVPENNYPITSELSGLWRNTDWSAQGFHVRYLGKDDRNELFVGWLSWDNSNNPEWYWSVMQIDEQNYALGELRTGRDAGVVGKCDMYFTDDGHGTFRATTDKNDIGHFVFPVTRLSVSVPDDINGFWGIGDNQGLSIERTNRETVAGFIYTYAGSGPYSTRRNVPEWKMVLGSWGEPLTVYDVVGGVRGTKTDYDVIPESVLTVENLGSDKTIVWDGNLLNATSLA